MKIETSALNKALKTVAPAIDKKTTLPILSGCLIKSSGGIATITGSNTDIEVTAKVQCDGEDEIVINHAKLMQFSAKAKAEYIDISDGAGKAIVKAGKSRITIPTMSASDYPSRDDEESQSSGTVSGDVLSHTINMLSKFSGRNDVRAYLNGIYFDGATSVATNGHALATIENDWGIECGHILPIASAPAFANLSGDFVLSFGNGFMSAESEYLKITSKTIDLRYPNWRQVMSSADGVCATVDRELFDDALERMEVAGPNVAIDYANGYISLKSRGKDESEAVEDVECSGNANHSTAYQISYMRGALACFESSTVEIYPSESGSHRVKADEGINVSIMPMRL